MTKYKPKIEFREEETGLCGARWNYIKLILGFNYTPLNEIEQRDYNWQKNLKENRNELSIKSKGVKLHKYFSERDYLIDILRGKIEKEKSIKKKIEVCEIRGHKKDKYSSKNGGVDGQNMCSRCGFLYTEKKDEKVYNPFAR